MDAPSNSITHRPPSPTRARRRQRDLLDRPASRLLGIAPSRDRSLALLTSITEVHMLVCTAAAERDLGAGFDRLALTLRHERVERVDLAGNIETVRPKTVSGHVMTLTRCSR